MAKETAAPAVAFPIKYVVENIEPWTMLDKRGNPTPAFRVTFTFEGGISDFVDIPEKVYQPEAVKSAIEDRITLHLGVLTL